MRLKELINRYKWNEISSAIIRLYPDQKRGIQRYKKVLAVLCSIKPGETKWSIVIEDCFDEDEQEYYVDVSAKNPGEQQLYALDLTNWEEWLGMEISYRTLRKYSKLDIIAHCLWEMTWHGYEQKDIENFNKEVCRTMKGIQKDNERIKQ